jgi:hypothetical protein
LTREIKGGGNHILIDFIRLVSPGIQKNKNSFLVGGDCNSMKITSHLRHHLSVGPVQDGKYYQTRATHPPTARFILFFSSPSHNIYS